MKYLALISVVVLSLILSLDALPYEHKIPDVHQSNKIVKRNINSAVHDLLKFCGATGLDIFINIKEN